MQLTLFCPHKDTIAISSVALNSTAKLIARCHSYSYNLASMTDVQHCLPATSGIQCKVFLLVSRAQQGNSPRYRWDLMRTPLSALSSRAFRCAYRLDGLVPRIRTAINLAAFGPSLWNDLPLAIRAKIFTWMPFFPLAASSPLLIN